MTGYRFRMKLAADPRAVWRDIEIGEECTLVTFHRSINEAMGLDYGHLWFFGPDQAYWNSDVWYRSPQEAQLDQGTTGWTNEEEYDAGETTIGDLVERLDLAERDRICYLYDYGDEWRFYGILKEIMPDVPSETEPSVVKTKGDSVDQYGPSRKYR